MEGLVTDLKYKFCFLSIGSSSDSRMGAKFSMGQPHSRNEHKRGTTSHGSTGGDHPPPQELKSHVGGAGSEEFFNFWCNLIQKNIVFHY